MFTVPYADSVQVLQGASQVFEVQIVYGRSSWKDTMKKTDIAYCAGLFDGEGCVTILWPKRATVCMEINMTHKPTLKKYAAIMGGTVKPHYNSRPDQRRQYRVRFFNGEAIRVAKLFLPYLSEKKGQARMLIKIREQAKTDRDKDFCKSAFQGYKKFNF